MKFLCFKCYSIGIPIFLAGTMKLKLTLLMRVFSEKMLPCRWAGWATGRETSQITVWLLLYHHFLPWNKGHNSNIRHISSQACAHRVSSVTLLSDLCDVLLLTQVNQLMSECILSPSTTLVLEKSLFDLHHLFSDAWKGWSERLSLLSRQQKPHCDPPTKPLLCS